MSDKPHNCMDCRHKEVIPDPDPNDWFNDDDCAVMCLLTPKTKEYPQNTKSKFRADHHPNRAITVACRPYNRRKECETPTWCPLGLGPKP
jgi:hypothetical protein